MAYPMGHQPVTPLDIMLMEQQAKERAETSRPKTGYSGLTDIDRARMGHEQERAAENEAYYAQNFPDPSLIPTDPVGDALGYAVGGIPKLGAGLGMGMFKKPLLKDAVKKVSRTPIADARKQMMESAKQKSLADIAMDIVSGAKKRVGKIFEGGPKPPAPKPPAAAVPPPHPTSAIRQTTQNLENVNVEEILRQQRIKQMESQLR